MTEDTADKNSLRRLGEEAVRLTGQAKEKSDKAYSAILRLTEEDRVDNFDYARTFSLKGKHDESQLLRQFDEHFLKILSSDSQEKRDKAFVEAEYEKSLLHRLGFTDEYGKTTDNVLKELENQHDPSVAINIYVVRSPKFRGVSLVREVEKVGNQDNPTYRFKEHIFVGKGPLLKERFFANPKVYSKT